MKNLSAGIDFGTTNSSAAIPINGNPTLVPLENKNITIPTAMYFMNDGVIHFGRSAVDNYTANETSGRFMRSIKRILGSPLMKSSGTQVGSDVLKFDKIIETFVRHLKEKIDAAAGANVENVVMGRPVHFRENDAAGDMRAQEELHQIAINAGFKNVAFQYEPIAAAFAHERLLTSEKLAVVIDIGGGTSDFTVIRLSPERMKDVNRAQDVLSNTGVRIGGNDFDKNLSLWAFMPEFGMGTELSSGGKILPMPTGPFFTLSTWNEINDLYNFKRIREIEKLLFQSQSSEKVARLLEIVQNQLGHKNLNYVEDAKIKLSADERIEMALDFLSDAPKLSITQKDFNGAILNNIERINTSINECIKDAQIKPGDINLVVVTGGSTEIPAIESLVRMHFPNAEISATDKLSSVGLGLGYDAMRRF